MSDDQTTDAAGERFIVRMPAGMREAIREAARASGRSMNAEILHRIEQNQPISRRLEIASRILAGSVANPSNVGRLYKSLSIEALASADDLIEAEREIRPL